MAAMGALRSVNGVELYVEEHGDGAPILCVHGTGSAAWMWDDALPELARHGRVIAYDRRGCARSPLPEGYERTSPGEQAGDAAALLEELGGGPAVVIGRSYGGDIAVALVLRRPELVRALALLEGAPSSLSPPAAAWERSLDDLVIEAAALAGIDVAGQTLIDGVFGTGAWLTFPEPVQRLFTDNGPAIVAEMRGGGLPVDRAAVAMIRQPVLVIAAEDSQPAFRDAAEALAALLPDSRLRVVGGDHIVDPASPEVLAFLAEVLA
jgi:pimeloyl-ACP methyl ester carboxylesterase